MGRLVYLRRGMGHPTSQRASLKPSVDDIFYAYHIEKRSFSCYNGKNTEVFMVEFIKNCLLVVVIAICGVAPETDEGWKYLLFGGIGLFVFLAVFFGLMWYIHKYFFVRKNFLAEHVGLISLGSAFASTVIYYVIAYVFFYR